MISIIIPAYNAQAYLRECLESVLAQSFSDWEAIVVNDGSTDCTLEIANSYAEGDPRVKAVTTPNRGLSSARNAGLEIATGEWITYLDSDDMLLPDALSAMAGESAGVDVVIGNMTRTVSDTRSKGGEVRLISGREALAEGLYQTSVSTSACGKLFRAESVGGIRFADGLYYEDILYCTEVFLRVSAVRVIPETVYYYRENSDSFINTFSPKRLDVLEVTRRVEGLCADDPALVKAANDRRLSANFNIYNLLSVCEGQSRYDEIRRGCWRLIAGYRWRSLVNPRVRLKNRLGILLTLAGRGVYDMVSRLVGGRQP